MAGVKGGPVNQHKGMAMGQGANKGGGGGGKPSSPQPFKKGGKAGGKKGC